MGHGCVCPTTLKGSPGFSPDFTVLSSLHESTVPKLWVSSCCQRQGLGVCLRQAACRGHELSQHQDLGEALDQAGALGWGAVRAEGASGVCTAPSLPLGLMGLRAPGAKPCYTPPTSPHGAVAQIRPLTLSLPGAMQGFGGGVRVSPATLVQVRLPPRLGPGLLDTHPLSCS